MQCSVMLWVYVKRLFCVIESNSDLDTPSNGKAGKKNSNTAVAPSLHFCMLLFTHLIAGYYSHAEHDAALWRLSHLLIINRITLSLNYDQHFEIV